MPVNPNDPRVKRTRQLLLQSFMELIEQRKIFTPFPCRTLPIARRLIGPHFTRISKISMLSWSVG